MAATLLPNGVDSDGSEKCQEEGQVTPPDDRVAQQVHAVVVSREVLALVVKKYLHYEVNSVSAFSLGGLMQMLETSTEFF